MSSVTGLPQPAVHPAALYELPETGKTIVPLRSAWNVTALSVLVDATLALPAVSCATPAASDATASPFEFMPVTATL